MTADIIALPERRPRGPQPKRRLDDMRVVPFSDQPPAVTKPGEAWYLNGFHMSQVIVIRDGPDDAGHTYVDGRHQIAVAEFRTVRDAASAVQARAIVELVVTARDEARTPTELGRMVADILTGYGR